MEFCKEVIQYGWLYIFYALMAGVLQSLCVFWIAKDYLKIKRSTNIFYVLWNVIFILHDTWWTVIGYSENTKNDIRIIEVFVFCLMVYFMIKKFCEESTFYIWCHLLGIEFWYQIIGVICTFPFYIILSNFDASIVAEFMKTPSLGNIIYSCISYWIVAAVAKKVWYYVYKHRSKFFKGLCFLLAFLDMLALFIPGWRIIVIGFVVVFVIFIFSFLQQNKNEKALREQFQYYQELSNLQKQKEKEISFIRHDIANHLSVIEEMRRDEEGQKILKRIDKSTRNFMGIPVVDCLIREKEKRCAKEGIVFVKEGVPFTEMNISEYELVSLLANLLDNAIEATKDVVDKRISIMTKLQQGYLKIVVENTKLSDETPIQNNFRTTKKDKKKHGIGNYIIREIVEKNGGRITWKDEGGVMKVTVLLQV